MKNKILAFVFSFVASMSLSTAWAYDFKVDSLYYTITSSTEPYTVEVAQDASYKAWTTVTLPNTVTNGGITYTVTRIASDAFRACNSLLTMKCNQDLLSIGSYAFEGCNNLLTVVLPRSMSSIENRAFYRCANLSHVICEGEKKEIKTRGSIGDHAFYDCYVLQDIEIPEGIWAIEGSGNFSFNWQLRKVIIPSTMEYIGAGAFYDCSKLDSLIIPDEANITYIGEDAFYNNAWLNKQSDGLVYLNKVLFSYKGEIPATVVVKDGTRCIAGNAFNGCSSLSSITIPEEVTSLGESLFLRCSSLASVTLPNNLITIGRSAFEGCTSLTSITIPNKVTTIQEYAFYNCTSLSSISIPESVTYLANNAFGSSGLKHITWHPKNYNNGNPGDGNSRSPFYYIKDSIQSITFGENVDTIPYRMCWEMYNLKSVSLPDNLKCIEYDAFSACKSLESIDIPNGVTYIGNYAFNECYSLPSITLPDSLQTIEQYAFRLCTLLTSITIPEKIAILSDRAFQDSGLDTIIWTPKNYDTGGNSPFYYVKDHIKSVIFTDNVEAIPWNMCWEMYNLQSVEIPNSVDTIRPYAFRDCRSLLSINIPKTVKHIDGGAFYGCSALTSIELPKGIRSMGDEMFYNCTVLTSISIPDSVTTIGRNVFYNSGITSVVWNPKDYNNTGNSPFDPIKANITSITFSDNVEVIPYRLCYNMSNLTDINGGKNVKRIGKEAFYGVPFEEGPIYVGRVLYGYSGTMPDNYSLTLRDNTIGIANNAFQNQQNLLMITFNEGLEEIGSEAFRNCQALLSLKFPNSLRTIGNSAFYDCYGLTMAKLGGGLQSIGEYAFRYCSALNTSVTFPETLQTIGRGVFEGCTNLPSITVQGTVERIEESTFRGCNQLKTIVLPNTVNYIGQYAFYDCHALKDFALPSSLTKIDYRAFENNHALNSLVLPNSVDTLCDRAFYNCDGLNSVQFGENLKYIGKESFCESNNLKSVTFNESLLNIDDRAFQSCSQLQAVQLNQKLQRIGHEAFRYCGNLRDVIFGDSLATIGERAFKRSGITSADLSKTQITNLPTRAFRECGSLVSVNFPKTLAEMGTECFYKCQSLRLAELPQGMTTLPNHAFYGCTNLTSVHIPNSMVTIMNNVFQSCSNLLSVTLPENVLSVGAESFRYCSKLATLNLAMDQPISVGSNVFDGVTFSAINVPCGSKSTYMEDERWAVYDSIMHEVTLAPYNIIALPADGRRGVVDVQVPNTCDGDAAYTLTVQPYYGYKFTQWNDGNTDNPRSVVLTQDTSLIATIERDSYEINAVPNFLERGKIEGSGSYLYLDTVTLTVTPNYGYYFDYWQDRSNYSNSDSQKKANPRKVIANKDTTYTAILQKNQYTIQVEVTNPDLGAVNYPSKGYYLDTITMSSNVLVGYRIVEWGDGCTDDPRTFVLTQDTTFTATLGQAFNGKCGANAYWAFSDSTLTITGSGDMYNYNSNNAPWQLLKEQIKKVVISAGITSIGRYAFYGCSSLAAVDIPKTVVNIYDYSFENCISLTSLIIPKSVTCIEGQSTFRNTGITSINWNARNYNDSYDGSPFSFIAGTIESFVFGDEVEVIPAQLCQGMSKLTQIVIPSSVDSMHFSAFYNCSGLTQVVFNEGLQYISNSVFQNCSSLTNVVLPTTLEALGSYAFEGCSNLTTVQLPASMSSIGANAFASLINLVSVTCKGNTKEITEPGLIGGHAFYECHFLREMQIPEGIRAICSYSFGYNFALTSISLPTTLDSIGTHAFYGSCALQSVTIPAAVKHIEENALQDCGSLQLVQMLPSTPPTMIGSAISSSAIIAIPCDTKEAYISNDVWASYTDKLVEKSLSNYRVQVSAQDSISGVVNVQSPDCDSDGAYTITAQPSYGYKFTQWQDGNTDNPRKVVLTQDTTFVATMVRDGFLVQGVPNYPERGEVTGGTTALYGDTVTLTVTPNYGYYFDYWLDRQNYYYESDRRENPRKVIADKDTTYTAVFQKKQYSITVNITNAEDGLGSISYPRSGYYLDTITMTGSLEVGYKISWSDGSIDDPRKFVLTQDTTFTATIGQAYDGKCGDDVYWAFHDTILTITGTGDMYNYSQNNAPWQLFKEEIKEITIAEGITRIGNFAFYNIKGVTSIVIPESITSVGENALNNCSGLTTVVWNAKNCPTLNSNWIYRSSITSFTFGEQVEVIPSHVCYNLSKLSSIILPESVTSIGYSAFYGCSGISSLDIPAKVDSIAERAFYNCHGLDSLAVSCATRYIAASAFSGSYGNNLISTVTLKANSVEEYAQSNINKLLIDASVSATRKLLIGDEAPTDIIIPNTITRINYYAFWDVDGINSIIIPSSVTKIDSCAFYSDAIRTISIPCTVDSIGGTAFMPSALENLIITTTNLEQFLQSDINLLLNAANANTVPRTLWANGAEVTNVLIPNSITEIKERAFYRMANITSVNMPEGVIKLGSYAFAGCNKLEVVKLPNSLDTIPVRAFDQCSLLATVDLGDSIKRIDDYAFASCFRLVTLRMPEALKSIGSYVFSNCSNLTSIHLPMLVPPTIISNKTFYAATKLSSFYVPCGAKDNYTSDANWSSFASKINERYFTDYTITTASTNDAWGIVTLNEPTSCADTTYNFVANSYDGYHFVQWQDGNTENPRTIALTQDTAFTAEFARNTYTISTRPNIEDRGVTSEAQSALYMDSVEIAAVAKYGYHFTQWNDGNTDNPRKVVVTEDKTYQAQFDKNRYAVHANCDDELGAITYPDSVEYLDVIELEVDPIFGYHFVQWQDGNTDNPRRVQITQDTTFTAYCAINEYAISVIANYEERGTTEGSGTYRHGDSITMSATAKYGYHFIRWQDSEEVDISKDAIYSTIVTKQIDYVAIFGKNVYQITTESTDNTKGYVDAVTHAEYLDEVILTAVPEVGYYFTQWNDGNTDNPRTIILTQDTTFAASFEIATSGSCGEDAFWSYQDGHLNISGQNDMYDYSGYSSTPWMLYREQIKSVSIADGVTRIGTNAFSNCTNLETIEIPNSVREIAAMAFANCGKLTTFTVPEQTIHIDADVFTGCAGITSITWNAISYQDSQKASTSPLKPLSEQITTFTVGEKVKYIPANLLPAMPALHTVNWNAVAGDDYYAHNNTPFYTNRDQIKVFTIGDNVEYIPEYLCYNLNAITAVQLPNTVTSVGAYAFAECSKLKDIAMGTALKVIGYRAFANCESIVELHIGESVETIDRYAFYNCNAVTKISIGSHVNWIGDHAFDNCTQVEEIYCYAPNPPTAERRTFYSYTPILRVSYTAGALYRSDSIFGLFNTIGYYDNTGVEDLVIDGITITNGTIHCNEPFTIYDLLGNNVTASNGSLQGVYIVRTASAAQKVVLNSNINL